MYRPQHMSQAEIDQVFERKLKELEAMHLTALIHQRVLAVSQPGTWDTAQGEDLIAAVRQDWKQIRGDEVT